MSVYRRIDLGIWHFVNDKNDMLSLKDITVKKIKSHKEQKLSKSLGNVNFADIWIEIMNDSLNTDIDSMNDKIFYVSMLSDEFSEDETQCFWASLIQKRIAYIELKFTQQNEKKEEFSRDLKTMIKNNGKYFYTLGNADLIIILKGNKSHSLEEIVETFKGLARSKEIYSYNILFLENTSMKEELLFSPLKKADGTLKEEVYINPTAKEYPLDTINNDMLQNIENKLIISIKEYIQIRNKKMLAFFQSLLQIVRIIQGQRTKNVKYNLFYLFYPQVVLFINQLEQGVDSIKQKDVQQKCLAMESIEKSIRDFIDITEILLHHIEDSSRNMMGNFNYGLLADDIPIKLCFFYLAYMHEVTALLNDSENEYQYCFSPLAYSIPETGCFEFGLQPKSRLIKVMISKHMMFMPRSILVILAHEVSHYSGDNMRCRKLRAIIMQKILSYILCEVLYNIDVSASAKSSEIICAYYKTSKDTTRAFIDNTLEKLMIEEYEKMSDDIWYHFRYYFDTLMYAANKICYDENWDLERTISIISPDIVKQLRSDPFSLTEIDSIQQEIGKQLAVLLAEASNNVVFQAMNYIKKAMKEIFADLSAIMLLNIPAYDYLECYITSEGTIPDNENITVEIIHRIAMVLLTLKNNDYGNWKNDWTSMRKQLSDDSKTGNNQKCSKILEYIYQEVNNFVNSYESLDSISQKQQDIAFPNNNYCAEDFLLNIHVIKYEIEYFQKCYEELKSHLQKKDNDLITKTKRQLIQNIYLDCAAKPKGTDNSFYSFFELYDELVQNYITDVNTQP